MINKSAFFIFMVFMISACATHTHRVGDGAPSGSAYSESRQWYALFGLVPLNEADSLKMSQGVNDYEIKTEVTPFDFIMNIFTGLVTINSRTVTVTLPSDSAFSRAIEPSSEIQPGFTAAHPSSINKNSEFIAAIGAEEYGPVTYSILTQWKSEGRLPASARITDIFTFEEWSPSDL